jgi:alkylation response protein AidB-like acyl-CoA dehydrogenase
MSRLPVVLPQEVLDRCSERAPVYDYGLARRVFDLTTERLKKKRVALTRSMAYHPGIQNAVADMALELEGIEPHLDRVAAEWSDGVDHGAAWPAKIFGVKYRAVEGAWRVVDTALDVAGGFGIFNSAGLERMFRDARLGRIHPANAFLTREIVARTALGIGLDETPRWG